ncbi:MAG: NAD(P)-binding domain-containing protein, partial [Solirubrobacterales bacterium]
MSDLTSPVAIVGGTGALGSALALQLAKAGVNVRIGSRKLESAEEAAGRVQTRLGYATAPVSGHVNEEAVLGCEV